MPERADFYCSKCKKPYRWTHEYAGKVAQCTCGGVLQFPLHDPRPRDPLAIAYNIPDSEGPPRMAPSAVPFVPVDLEAAVPAMHGITMYQGEDPTKANEVRDIHVPFGLLTIALFLVGWSIADSNSSLLLALVTQSVSLGLNVGITLLGLMFAARVMGIDLGPLRVAAFKLTALVLSLSVMQSMVLSHYDRSDIVIIAAWLILSVILYWVGLAYFFRLTVWQLVGYLIIIFLTYFALGCVLGILAGFLGGFGAALR